MRVLFIYPNLNAQIGFNYGVAFLSAVLRRHGHITRLLNINESLCYPLDLERIVSDVKAFSPDLVGFSLVSNQFQCALGIAKAIRGHTQAPFVCGGIHATMAPHEVLETDIFDYACLGEGEEALLELVNALEEHGDTTKIPNMWVKRNGRVIENRVRPFTPLEDLPPSALTVSTTSWWIFIGRTQAFPSLASDTFAITRSRK
jgi:radical SAM superfamily enzyme YgiQ (UPF0313 family)